MSNAKSASSIDRLRAIMAQLRAPVGGCPWDVEQTFETIAPYTIEEAYEVEDAIRRGDMADLRDELGDLLFQVVFHAQMASEQRLFDFDDVAEGVCRKMERRHPHVFGDASIEDARAQEMAWEAMKAKERADRAKDGAASILADVPRGLPALLRALKLQKRAARVGFDWPNADDVLAKIVEEAEEVAQAKASGDQAAIEDELGDLLFVVANLARKLDVDPETALRGANAKFARRFAHIERALAAAGRDPANATLDEMETLWVQAKNLERST